MSEQRTFAGLAWTAKTKVTRRERFLADMNAVIPWAEFVAVIAPYYPMRRRHRSGRPPMRIEAMLRIYFLQHWFDLSDPAAEDALYDSEAMRRFVGVELTDDAIPDETTILRFRRLLETHHVTEQFFALVCGLLETHGLLLKTGTIADATIIRASSSTKNASKARDPEMRQTKKGTTWYFGMKVHTGTDPHGLVHTLTTTDAATPELAELPHLLHGAERVLYGDRAYWKETDRAACGEVGIHYRVNRRGSRHAPVSARWRLINRARSRVRARVEHA